MTDGLNGDSLAELIRDWQTAADEAVRCEQLAAHELEPMRAAMGDLALDRATDRVLAATEQADARPLSADLLGALWSMGVLLVEAHSSTGARRAECLSAARGWLRIVRSGSD